MQDRENHAHLLLLLFISLLVVNNSFLPWQKQAKQGTEHKHSHTNLQPNWSHSIWFKERKHFLGAGRNLENPKETHKGICGDYAKHRTDVNLNSVWNQCYSLYHVFRCIRDFNKGQIVIIRRLGQSNLKTAGLIGCSRYAVVSTHQMWSKEGELVKQCQGHEYLRLINAPGEWRLALLKS